MGNCNSQESTIKYEKLARAEKTLSLNIDNENQTTLDYLNDHPIPNLNVFSAQRNRLKTLPKFFFDRLNQIKKIELSFNQFEFFDDFLFERITLEKLNISWNRLKILDIGFCNLIYLKEIDLSNNKINGIDENLVFPNLENINLSFNNIKYLPNSLIINKKLDIIKIGNNFLDRLPEENWEISNITVLNIENNNLSYLPKNLLSKSKVSLLNLKNNKITKVQIMNDYGFDKFENRRKLKKDQGYSRNLDINFNFCGLD